MVLYRKYPNKICFFSTRSENFQIIFCSFLEFILFYIYYLDRF
jgi:hypothetical protein